MACEHYKPDISGSAQEPVKANTRYVFSFTLLELLLAVGILSVLGTVSLVALNPLETLRTSRDTQRLADIDALHKAINFSLIENTSASLGISNTVYISLPDASSTCGTWTGLPVLPSGWLYHCAPAATYLNVDGTGWIPVNFKALSMGSPIARNSLDPINDASHFYTYVTNPSAATWEFSSTMESQKYKAGGSNDKVSTDGGSNISLYEKGTNLNLIPIDYGDSSMVGWWKMTEGSGTVANDSSGNNKTASLVNSPSWVVGKNGSPYAIAFNGTNQSLAVGNTGQAVKTVSAWVKLNSAGGSQSVSTNAVMTSATGFATYEGVQRKIWYDGTRYWQAFSDGAGYIRFYYSSNGITWTQNVSAAMVSSAANNFSIYADASRIYIGYTDSSAKKLYICSSSSYPSVSFSFINCTWVYGYSISNSALDIGIARDSSGYVWITYTEDIFNDPDETFDIVVRRSTNPDNVTAWNTATYITTSGAAEPPVIVPRTGGAMYVVYYSMIYGIQGKNYNGTSWDASPVTISASGTNAFSASTDNSGNVHLVYVDTSGRVQYQEYTGSWQPAVAIDTNAGNSNPVISIDSANGNAVYALWIRANQIYYKKGSSPYTSGNWGVASSAYSTGTNKYLVAGYSDFGSGKNALFSWTNGTANPYTVMWGAIATSGGAANSFVVDFDSGGHTLSITNGTAVAATGFSSPTIYVDGVATSAISDTASWHFIAATTNTGFSANSMNIGVSGSTYLSGTLDDVRMYTRALSASEIQALYAATR